MDLRLAMMCGIDIPVPECKLFLHQPLIREIAYLGEEEFFFGSQVLCLNKSMFIQDKTLLSSTTNFQIFMMIMSEKEMIDKKKAALHVLSLLLPKYKINITPRALVVMPENGDPITIDDNNFDDLQVAIKEIFCVNRGQMDTQSFNPSNDKAKEIAQKLMRGRQRVAEQNGSAMSSVFCQYLSILTVGINSMPISELMNLTIFQLYDLIERYSLYTNWDMDVRCRLAGGKPESQPDNWMKNIH